MPKYKVGELCVIGKYKVVSAHLEEWAKGKIGQIVEIEKAAIEPPLKERANPEIPWYYVRGVNEGFYAREDVLKRLPPPPPKVEELGSWDIIRDLTGYKQRELEV